MNECAFDLSREQDRELDAGREQSPIESLPVAARTAFARQGIVGLGDSYRHGLWETPRVDSFMYDLFRSPQSQSGRTPWGLLGWYLVRERLLNVHAPRWAFSIGQRHYDLGNDLFTAMLDRSMTYTCGYWENASSLDEAQEAKLELICRKLNLRPGMHVLDIGCGWGNFAHHASKRYGVRVTGLTVSKEQASLAQKRCAGLPVEILLQDYRSMHREFDHVVSVEMIEAVGKRNIPTFFNAIDRNLKPGGKVLIQAISAETFSRGSDKALNQFTLWIMKRIFPDGYLPNVAELMAPTKKLFNLEGVQSFGPDYDKTLMAWSENFKRNWPVLDSKYDEKFYRTWVFYLEGCAALFRARKAHLFQILYSKPGAQ